MKIGLLTAMQEEMEAYNPKATKAKDEVIESEGILHRVSGIGKVNASIATMELIQAGAEAIFIGGVCATTRKEDYVKTYLLTVATQHDYGVMSKNIEIYRPGTIPGNRSTEIWYRADNTLILKGLKFCKEMGTIATGDQFISNSKKVKSLSREFHINLLDMETAAVAQVCFTKKIPWLGLKTTTDRASSGSEEKFWKNLPLAVNANARIGNQIISFISNSK